MSETRSPAELLASLSDKQRKALIDSQTDEQLAARMWDWRGFWARPNQLPPGDADWLTWIVKSGRGFGKTRLGAEWVREEKNTCERTGIIGRTAADCRDILIEGESGILSISPPWDRPEYTPSKRKLEWKNGAQAFIYSADEPDVFRGPQFHRIWADEFASWKYPETAWDNIAFGLRLGHRPRALITTTPRPLKILKLLMARPTTRTVSGSTYDNLGNLPESFIAEIKDRFEGTRLGRQEIHGDILNDNPNALWQRADIDADRMDDAALRAMGGYDQLLSTLHRVVVGVDPSVSNTEDSDECGIIVAGCGYAKDRLLYGFVLNDASGRVSTHEWASRAVYQYHTQRADRIVAEVNNGGDLVESAIRQVDPNVAYSKVHASKGKYVRAEPIAALYEQHRIHHVGSFPELEDQMCEFVPGSSQKSPDRMDALVWALTELMTHEWNPRARLL